MVFPDANRVGRAKAVTSIPILLGHFRQLHKNKILNMTIRLQVVVIKKIVELKMQNLSWLFSVILYNKFYKKRIRLTDEYNKIKTTFNIFLLVTLDAGANGSLPRRTSGNGGNGNETDGKESRRPEEQAREETCKGGQPAALF